MGKNTKNFVTVSEVDYFIGTLCLLRLPFAFTFAERNFTAGRAFTIFTAATLTRVAPTLVIMITCRN